MASLDYSIGPYHLMLQQRHVRSTTLNIRWQEGVHVDDNSVPSGNYTNLRAGYGSDFRGGSSWRVALNVTNLFNRAPPRVPNNAYFGGSPTTDNFFDVFGRRYQISFDMEF